MQRSAYQLKLRGGPIRRIRDSSGLPLTDCLSLSSAAAPARCRLLRPVSYGKWSPCVTEGLSQRQRQHDAYLPRCHPSLGSPRWPLLVTSYDRQYRGGILQTPSVERAGDASPSSTRRPLRLLWRRESFSLYRSLSARAICERTTSQKWATARQDLWIPTMEATTAGSKTSPPTTDLRALCSSSRSFWTRPTTFMNRIHNDKNRHSTP
ncbi:hypothetical protein O3G_MSEX007232 [Manduca sexta]|uniref:Uncharacterized protein n=1 Tax=Manduca sexta TaxID=7130 RepID=A0A922CN86_MANSE|nr:hypothetical protein O3G_MSEX007232 [Manduca sexta]